MEKRKFHLGDVLTITTGYLMAPSGFGAVYEILDFMTGDSNYTHQLPRVADECAPYLLNQFPQLREVSVEDLTPENVEKFLAEQVQKYGEYLMVEKIPMDDHTVRDPLEELREMTDKPIIIIDGDEEGRAP